MPYPQHILRRCVVYSYVFSFVCDLLTLYELTIFYIISSAWRLKKRLNDEEKKQEFNDFKGLIH